MFHITASCILACQDRKTEHSGGHHSQDEVFTQSDSTERPVDSVVVIKNLAFQVHLVLRSYLHVPSSGSSRPNLSSNVSWSLMLAVATSLQTISMLLGYRLGKSGLWIIPSPETVMIFSCWESWTPGTEKKKKKVCSVLDCRWIGLDEMVCTQRNTYTSFTWQSL